MSIAPQIVAPQILAADPRLTVFVTANAGSGKTTTLVNRVARLLLDQVDPGAILCVTYTKAAAVEMQARLFDQLGGWAVLDDAALSRELARLDDGDPQAMDHAALSRARKLFARALETPGGLKIQTIHAFCEKLLRRFPRAKTWPEPPSPIRKAPSARPTAISPSSWTGSGSRPCCR